MRFDQTDPMQPLPGPDHPAPLPSFLDCDNGKPRGNHRFDTKLQHFWWFFFSHGSMQMPVNWLLIEHRDGLVLLDAGIDPSVASDKVFIKQAIGCFPVAWIFRLIATDRIDHVCICAGAAAPDIRIAVLSHLRFDHVDEISQIPQSNPLVSAGEWARSRLG